MKLVSPMRCYTWKRLIHVHNAYFTLHIQMHVLSCIPRLGQGCRRTNEEGQPYRHGMSKHNLSLANKREQMSILWHSTKQLLTTTLAVSLRNMNSTQEKDHLAFRVVSCQGSFFLKDRGFPPPPTPRGGPGGGGPRDLTFPQKLPKLQKKTLKIAANKKNPWNFVRFRVFPIMPVMTFAL